MKKHVIMCCIILFLLTSPIIGDSKQIEIKKEKSTFSSPPMDSPWPMYCHDVRHTGRSPYSTAHNNGEVKWWFKFDDLVRGSCAIDNDGIIYLGSLDFNLYAVYPNGTKKWSYHTVGYIRSGPAIDENGIIYAGTYLYGSSFYAIYPNGTLKWRYTATDDIFSSPAIGEDGTIFFGDSNHDIKALYPNGTLRWSYKTGHVVYSSPAIGDDGTVYCGSHDTYLYALYPNNGTLKWKFKTGDWIRTSPCIADDGTIYVVSLDNYLYALYSNGTLKWKTDVGGGTSPTISQDGTIYCGYDKLYAIDPTNGSVKWKYDVTGNIRGGTPCNSVDGSIFFGTSEGDEIIALYPDGTLKWRKKIGTVEFAPTVGEDGIIFVGVDYEDSGYLYAFGELDENAPNAPIIDGPTDGIVGIEYEYTFKSSSTVGNDVYYWIEWGDGDKTGWIGPYNSGEEITESHRWSNKGIFKIRARAKDTDNMWGPWNDFEVEIPRNKVSYSSLFHWFLYRFPILTRLLYLMKKDF